MKAIFKNFYDEHQELYSELDNRLKELSKNKKEIKSKHLFSELEKLLNFTKNLLDNHFFEEDKIYAELSNEIIPEKLELLFNKIKNDHIEIREKYQVLEEAYKNLKNQKTDEDILRKDEDILQKDEDILQKDEDILRKKILFPSYNLIASINHHAQREDKFFQDLRD